MGRIDAALMLFSSQQQFERHCRTGLSRASAFRHFGASFSGGGAILFYYLLYRSGAVPRALSLWGLITVAPLLVATVLGIFEYEVPFVVALPYVPFEFVIGVWILVKGTQDGQ